MSTQAVNWAMDDAPMLHTDKGKPDTSARYVLWALAEHARPDGTNAHPSVLRIQYRTGLDERTVQRALRRLEKAGLIEATGTVQGRTKWQLVMSMKRPESDWAELEAESEERKRATAERVRRHRVKRVTHSNDVTETHSGDVTESDVTHSDDVSNASGVRYVTHSDDVRNALSAALTNNQPPPEPSGTKNSPPPAAAPAASASGDAGQSSLTGDLLFDGNGNEAPAQPQPEDPTDFDAFWKAYPRKVGKGHARKAYAAALKRGADPAAITAAAARYRDDPRRASNDIKFTPHPSTWLNGERYDDEPEPQPGPQHDQTSQLPAVAGAENVFPFRDRQQQATDDMFDRAMARAKARMQQESS